MNHYSEYEASEGLARVANECERCGCMDDLKERDGLMVCYDCQEELDRAAWVAAHEAPHWRKGAPLRR